MLMRPFRTQADLIAEQKINLLINCDVFQFRMKYTILRRTHPKILNNSQRKISEFACSLHSLARTRRILISHTTHYSACGQLSDGTPTTGEHDDICTPFITHRISLPSLVESLEGFNRNCVEAKESPQCFCPLQNRCHYLLVDIFFYEIRLCRKVLRIASAHP